MLSGCCTGAGVATGVAAGAVTVVVLLLPVCAFGGYAVVLLLLLSTRDADTSATPVKVPALAISGEICSALLPGSV